MTQNVTLKTHGAWPKVWTPFAVLDPQDIEGRREFVGPNPWPRVPVGNYTTGVCTDGVWSLYWNTDRQQTGASVDAGGGIVKASGLLSDEGITIDAIVAPHSNVGPYPKAYRAWGWAGSFPSIGIGGADYRMARIVGRRQHELVTGLEATSPSGAAMALIEYGDLWFYPAVRFGTTTGIGLARSTDLGSTWTLLRDTTGAIRDLRPDWLKTTSVVFNRAVVVRDKVHLWISPYTRGTWNGQHHLVSKNGIDFANFYAGTQKEFGSRVSKGIIPLTDEYDLYGILPGGINGVSAIARFPRNLL